MANIILPPGWRLKENQVTSKAAYQNRRSFLKTLGLGSVGLVSTSAFACMREPSYAATSALSPDGPLDILATKMLLARKTLAALRVMLRVGGDANSLRTRASRPVVVPGRSA